MIKISELPAATNAGNLDVFPVVQGGVTKKLSVQDLKNSITPIEVIDSFEDGATITTRSQALRVEATGDLYRWNGNLPKVVPANSTPATTGGVSVSAWVRAQVERKEQVAYLDDFVHLVVNNDWSEALMACIASLRTNQVNLLQYIGGPEITAYSSGVVVLGRGTYRIRPGFVNITQDLGLTIKGQGSRRTNKSVKAPSTILVSGASTTTNYFGIKLFGNGARGAHFEDFDLNYDSSGFTGDLIHTVQTPGFTTDRIRLGWHNSPLVSARSCVRTAFDEFHRHTDIVMDGAVTPWLSDTTTILNGPSDFGGSTHMLINPVFYDATDCYMKHAANRTRQGLIIQNPSFDVIDVALNRAVDLANIDGFNWVGGICASSDVIVATQEWIRLNNVTGYINGVCFNDLVKAGSLINSNIEVSGCRFYCNDGLVFKGGSYTVHSNEVAKAINGFTVDPDTANDINFGQNYFGPLVNYSYVVEASAISDVFIDYNKNRDASTNKWFVPSDSNRVKIVNSANPRATFATATLSPTIYDTGTEFVSVGNTTQTVTLPTPTQGLELTFTHIALQPLTLNGNFLSGDTGVVSTAVSVANPLNAGQTITLESYSNVAWKVKSITGAWNFSGTTRSMVLRGDAAGQIVATGFTSGTTMASFYVPSNLGVRAKSISVVDSFAIVNIATGQTIAASITNISLASFGTSQNIIILTVTELSGLTVGQPVNLRTNSATSAITINF
jgi:hypothetical protein